MYSIFCIFIWYIKFIFNKIKSQRATLHDKSHFLKNNTLEDILGAFSTLFYQSLLDFVLFDMIY